MIKEGDNIWQIQRELLRLLEGRNCVRHMPGILPCLRSQDVYKRQLQAEMMDQVEVSEKKLKESLTYGYAGLNAQLNSGSISQDEYDLQHEYLSGQ